MDGTRGRAKIQSVAKDRLALPNLIPPAAPRVRALAEQLGTGLCLSFGDPGGAVR